MTLLNGDHSFVDTAKKKSICFMTLLNGRNLNVVENVQMVVNVDKWRT